MLPDWQTIKERRENIHLVGIALIYLNLELDVSNMIILFGSLALQPQQCISVKSERDITAWNMLKKMFLF